MRFKEFAATTTKVSEIGMGTYYDPAWIATAFIGWKRGAKSKVEAIRKGLDSGITLIDTAEIYGSERLVAEAVRERKRDDIFLASKVWSSHLHRDSVTRAFNKSLKRLGTSYIDLYQVHFPNSRVPILETMQAMEGLVREGKLKHVGVSNFSLAQIKEAQAALPRTELSSVQLAYSLVHRDVEAEILPFCDRERIALLAYYPLGHGQLPKESGLDGVARVHGRSRSPVALRWLADKRVVFPIPRASRSAHVAENAGASDWDLSSQETQQLNSLFS